ncbi:glycosyltransferase family 2 protein [Hyphomicrobium methylovorum]|uniref:glycosyltransferase family 2 protein n=1 Tax=Hyphomicrobium methylovorum TaxID=84 RepID=UPI0015E71DD1|nr:glycosyltransferase family A protein [Hyphomicrobium methylovorum]
MIEFVIAVCTARRPEMLRRCLNSLIHLDAPKDGRIQIVVIENDATPDSQFVVTEVASGTDLPIHYKLQTRRGIPYARNAALDLATSLNADWIALIDDDEYADPEWLVKLYQGCLDFAADVAHGPVNQICEGVSPDWWEPYSRPERKTGEILRGAPTNNILMRAELVRDSGYAMRFDERLLSGSEDIEFFRRAINNGARIIWVADAWLHESLPASRLTPRRLLARAYMVATSQTQVSQIQRGKIPGMLAVMPKILRRLVVGAISVPVSLLVWIVHPTAGRAMFYSGAFRIVKALGSLSGGFGHNGAYYRSTDGR